MSDAMNGRVVIMSTGIRARVLMCCGAIKAPVRTSPDTTMDMPSAVFLVELLSGSNTGKIYTGLIDGATLEVES